MKKLLFILLLSPLLTFAQADSTKTKAHDEFCVLIFSPKSFSSKLNINADLGKADDALTAGQRVEKSAVMSKTSVAEALNFMTEHGWEYLNSYSLSPSRDSNFYLHYIFRRKL